MGIFHRRAWGSLFGSYSIRLSDGQPPKVDFKFVGVEGHEDVADLVAVDMPDVIHGRLGAQFLWVIVFGTSLDNPDVFSIEDLGRFGIDLFVYCKQCDVRLARRLFERASVILAVRIDGPHNKT